MSEGTSGCCCKSDRQARIEAAYWDAMADAAVLQEAAYRMRAELLRKGLPDEAKVVESAPPVPAPVTCAHADEFETSVMDGSDVRSFECPDCGETRTEPIVSEGKES